jgi:hypothetical protein
MGKGLSGKSLPGYASPATFDRRHEKPLESGWLLARALLRAYLLNPQNGSAREPLRLNL